LCRLCGLIQPIERNLMKQTYVTTAQLRQALNLRDLSDPADGPHAMQAIVQSILDALAREWDCEVILHRQNPIASVSDNYDALNYPPDGASRDARYSRYVCGDTLLRTQTSALVPGCLRQLEKVRSDVLLALPGLVYRRDSVDKTHAAEPHHLDLWRLTNKAMMTSADLRRAVEVILNTAIPGVEWKLGPSPHPYTLNGVEINARWGNGWLEVGECGLAHPSIIAENLRQCEGITGLALGMGLDRMLMVRKNIPDIRLLRSTNPRVMAQMQDLSPYREVSSMPAVIRDLSIAVDQLCDNEELGDRVREALGDEAEIVEEVSILSETAITELPATATKRMGAGEGQKNVLLRVVLRALERTLTDEECNKYRDAIYRAVHQGTAWEWTTKS
jgi:phenylalanyl-tRNA synthetase alpha chain